MAALNESKNPLRKPKIPFSRLLRKVNNELRNPSNDGWIFNMILLRLKEPATPPVGCRKGRRVLRGIQGVDRRKSVASRRVRIWLNTQAQNANSAVATVLIYG